MVSNDNIINLQDESKNIENIYNKYNDINIIDMNNIKDKPKSEKELTIFLYTIFQYYLEKAINLINNSTTDDNRLKAKKIIESLIENSYINYIKSNKVIYTCLNGLLHFYLAQCILSLTETEIELDSEPHLNKSLEHFNQLPNVIKIRFINYCQEIYNNLGILYYNKGSVKKGLEYFGKAEQLYLVFNDVKSLDISNDFESFMKAACGGITDNISNNNNNNNNNNNANNANSHTIHNMFFNFYIDGGINLKNLEKNYTNTLFYYAQAFTTLGFRSKGIYYCSHTLKRQIEFNNFLLKDSVVNCITLTDYFLENDNFAQAEYLLLSALALLPVDTSKKKKLRAEVQMQLGRCYLDRLKFAVNQINNQMWISENNDLSQIVNKKVVNFTSLNVMWPKIDDIKDKVQATSIFRLSNTQFKRALEFFVLDGYVTEYININRYISDLYKHLIFFEDNNDRIFLMLERRLKTIEPIINQINDKVFNIEWQQLVLESAQIYAEYFEKSYEILRTQKISKAKSKEVNNYGTKSINYYIQLVDYIENEVQKQEEHNKTVEEFNTLITMKHTIARLYGKFLYSSDDYNHVKYKVDSMVKSLEFYKRSYNDLKTSDFTKTNSQLSEIFSMCEEMVTLLPNKIQSMSNSMYS